MVQPGRFVYFAYGSNMLLRRLAERTPSAQVMGTAILLGHRLEFTKVGQDGSGKCHIAETQEPSDCVYGVLYTINLDEKPLLDRAEGLGAGYDAKEVEVVLESGARIVAACYAATHLRADMRPYRWYKALVVAGAREHALPAAYMQALLAVEAVEDSDPHRRALHEQLLHRPPN